MAKCLSTIGRKKWLSVYLLWDEKKWVSVYLLSEKKWLSVYLLSEKKLLRKKIAKCVSTIGRKKIAKCVSTIGRKKMAKCVSTTGVMCNSSLFYDACVTVSRTTVDLFQCLY